MLVNKSSSPADKIIAVSEIAIDLPLKIRVNKNGRIEGVLRSTSPFVPASEDPGISGVATRDVVIDRATGVAARLFLPTGAVATGRRLPLVLFFHGGSFVAGAAAESAFCSTYHRCATALAARAGALVVSVEYRLAPEHPVTTAYDDAWTALRWAASFADPWLLYHADQRCTFLAGDGEGGNVAYHTAVRASRAGEGIDIEGLGLLLLVHPYLWESEWLPSEKAGHSGFLKPNQVHTQRPFMAAGWTGINPPDEEIGPLPCRRALVTVAEKGAVRERGHRFAVRIRGCWWGGEVTVVELHGGDHGFFHLSGTARAISEKLMESIVEFVNKKPTITPKERDQGLHDKKVASVSNGPCNKAVSAEVAWRTVPRSCL